MRDILYGVVLAGLSLVPDVAPAEIRVCDDPELTVAAESESLSAKVCAAAIGAKALIGSCGLEQRYPIHIAVVERAMHPSFGNCLAVFDQRTGCLQVSDIDGMPGLLADGDARRAMPPEALFAATITHEMAHALLQQSAGEVEIAATEQEFVANAFEMESLDPVWRDMLLATHPVPPQGSMSLVHISIYALEPRAFANNAWTLFHREEIGCSLIRKIADGKFRFPRR
ncbi:hypothetical protein E7811_01300 [Aliigemmobacter aestuarii]|uniref:Uncharacterized protein n=1 Tax=Aliigemmobacter aestuarii TaxID=1445661 RepID=A0A4S3MPX5_9RHOB|nr:DUF6639 family protein [Gemmobacter aestuarii]THD84417.1 hypothetical protein E7811_01300 [Gemmobacter aestuarii]